MGPEYQFLCRPAEGASSQALPGSFPLLFHRLERKEISNSEVEKDGESPSELIFLCLLIS